MSGKKHNRPRPDPTPNADSGEDFHRPRTSDLIAPGGKVDARAVRRHLQQRDQLATAPASPAATPAATPATTPAPIAPPSPGALIELDEDAPALIAAPTGASPSSDDDPDADDELPPARVVFKLKRDLNKRLDKYLTDRITFMSRAKLQALIENGGVLVNTRTAKSSTNLRAGDRVEVFLPPPPSRDLPEQDLPIDVLYEDDHMIVVNKSPDIIVHPARSELSGTMINALAYHFRHRSAGHLSAVGKEFARPGVVHRLDRQTSGVIVFAKSEQAHWQLALQFEHRTADKRYVAFAHGHLEPSIDVIDVPLGPSPSREKGYREKQVVRHDHLGKPAVTIYRVLGMYDFAGLRPALVPQQTTREQDTTRVSLVEVELKTGRTHQIRVHLQHRGHPLLADDMYGGRALPGPHEPRVQRVALHAARLAIRPPISGEPMVFVAPLAGDLRALLTALRTQPTGRIEPEHVPGSLLSIGALLKG